MSSVGQGAILDTSKSHCEHPEEFQGKKVSLPTFSIPGQTTETSVWRPGVLLISWENWLLFQYGTANLPQKERNRFAI